MNVSAGWLSRPWGDVLALAGGALMPFAFAPVGAYPLAVLLVATLLWSWEGQTPLRAAWRGALFGFGLFSVGIYWVFISLHDYGSAPAAFAALTTLSLVLLMASYAAVTGYLVAYLAPISGPRRWLLLAPAIWAILEWVRSWLFSGFSWLSLGYSQIDGPLAGLAPYLGTFGVGWAVWVSAGLVMLLLRSRWPARIGWSFLALLLWCGSWALGQVTWVERAGDPLRVSLIQGNISQELKWLPEQLEQSLAVYVGLSLDVGDESDLIIWPETAIPAFYSDIERDFIPALEAEAKRSQTDYLSGIPAGSWETGIFYNAVVSIGSSHGFYHKRHLVPFGEYLPLRVILDFFSHFVEIPMSDFTAGALNQPLLQAAGYPIGVSICYEAAFGNEIRRSLPQATFLVNLSNDAWFGNSSAPHQHLQMARMRALESGRYMARATNTGISAFIDARGNVMAQTSQFAAEVLQGVVQPLSGATPYVRLGDGGALVLFSALFSVALAWARRR